MRLRALRRNAGLRKRIERHRRGLVADGVKAQLKARLARARRPSCSARSCVNCGRPGVAGIVSEGRLHGRRARAERSIHEALEHAGVQHRDRSASWWARIFFNSSSGARNGSHSLMRRFELSFLLHLLEDQEEIPVAEVLRAGDAVRERVVDGEFSAAAAFFRCGRRNDLFHQVRWPIRAGCRWARRGRRDRWPRPGAARSCR